MTFLVTMYIRENQQKHSLEIIIELPEGNMVHERWKMYPLK